MGELHYGTSSWSEKSWAGVVYPEGLPPGEWLTHYATEFGAVEADVTYYRVPDRKLVQGWERKTPDGFLLSAKFPRSVVHAGDGPKPDGERVLDYEQVGDDVQRFLAAMSLMGEKCGPLVVQLPYLNRTAFANVDAFLERLDRFLGSLPNDFRYAVEVRNKNWIREPLLQLLRRHRAALVLVDLKYMPHPADLADEHDLFTTDFTYARLIGDRQAVDAKTKTFDKIVLDNTPRLERWADLLAGALKKLPSVFAFANNHYAGHGPATIRELAQLVAAVPPK